MGKRRDWGWGLLVQIHPLAPGALSPWKEEGRASPHEEKFALVQGPCPPCPPNSANQVHE